MYYFILRHQVLRYSMQSIWSHLFSPFFVLLKTILVCLACTMQTMLSAEKCTGIQTGGVLSNCIFSVCVPVDKKIFFFNLKVLIHTEFQVSFFLVCSVWGSGVQYLHPFPLVTLTTKSVHHSVLTRIHTKYTTLFSQGSETFKPLCYSSKQTQDHLDEQQRVKRQTSNPITRRSYLNRCQKESCNI